MLEPNRNYQHLGKNTLIILIISNTRSFIVFMFVYIGFLVGKGYISSEQAREYGTVINIAVAAGAVIAILLIASAFFTGWLEYIHYSIALDQNGLKIKRGFLTQKERSVPYRRIQEVKIHRTMFDQMWGVSSLEIDLLGDDEGQPLNDDRLTLSAVGKDLALEIRDELLKRSQVEQISVQQTNHGA